MTDPRLILQSPQDNCLIAGAKLEAGERVLIMDADLQDPPELLPGMLRLMERGADVVYAQRRTRPGDQAL